MNLYPENPEPTAPNASERLRAALRDILNLPLPLRPVSVGPTEEEIRRSAVFDLHRILSERSAAEQTAIRALVSAVTRTDGDPFAALVDDLSEILFLPRTERTEYRTCRLPSPPFVIEKLLLEYAFFASALDTLMGRLNKSFCSAHCPDPPVGCCRLLGYDLGLVPDRMLAVQRLEALRNGWRAPKHPDLRKCRYHTEQGCALRLFKSPACIGAMCRAVEDHLDATYPAEDVRQLREQLQTFRNCDIDRAEVFRAMQSLIEVGNRF